MSEKRKKFTYEDFAVVFATHWDKFHEQLDNFLDVLHAANRALPAPQAQLLKNRSVAMAKAAVEVATVFTIIDFLAYGGKTLKELLHQIRCESNISEEDEAFVKKAWNELKLLEKQDAIDGND